MERHLLRMSLMRPAPALLVLALSTLVPPEGAAAEARSPAERADAVLGPLAESHVFAGAVVLLRGGNEVYARGFGLANREAALPFSPDTPSDGGSMAKTFTATGLQWLAQEGRLALGMPVARLLPAYPHPKTTIRHLLSHSNGLPADYGFFDPHFGPNEVRTTDAMLAVAARVAPEPAFPPGSRFEYSNLGYDAAARVIEAVTGQDYATFVRERFFLPLGMSASFARPARLADWSGVRTRGYRFRADRWQDHDAFDNEAFLGASNLYFSARDLARWGQAMAAGQAVPARVAAAAAEPVLIAGKPSPINGLSWYVSADGERAHYTGTVQGFHAFLHWDRRRREVAAFVSNSALPTWTAISLQRALVAALRGDPESPPPPPDFDRVEGDDEGSLAGVYVVPGAGEVRLWPEAGRLRLRVGGGLDFEVFRTGRNTRYVPGTDWSLAFSGGASGRRLHVRSMDVDGVAPRSSP